MLFRRFNDKGVQAFAAYLDALRADPKAPVPTDLLTNPRLTQPLDPPIDAEPQPFNTRMDFCRWLHDAAKAAGTEAPRRDAGFWAWLTLALFDQVCPADSTGRRKPKEDARYLPLLDQARRYYRHALVGPYSVYLRYDKTPEYAAPLLCGSLAKLADEAYRLFVENQLVTYPAAVNILRSFYYDARKNTIKRGAGSKKAGSIRRLVKVLTQYGRTYDIDEMADSDLACMLPKEFDRWRTAPDLSEHYTS